MEDAWRMSNGHEVAAWTLGPVRYCYSMDHL